MKHGVSVVTGEKWSASLNNFPLVIDTPIH